jgi:hypothetical protein
MITKTKLTITIDKKTLNIFNEICDNLDINKSKLISRMIKEWIENHKK